MNEVKLRGCIHPLPTPQITVGLTVCHLTTGDHPFVILPSAKIYCSKTASNIFSHPPRRQRCNTLHFASKEVCQMFPLDSLKKSIYLQSKRICILFFSNHHIGIEPCDDYIVNFLEYKFTMIIYPHSMLRINKKASSSTKSSLAFIVSMQ